MLSESLSRLELLLLHVGISRGALVFNSFFIVARAISTTLFSGAVAHAQASELLFAKLWHDLGTLDKLEVNSTLPSLDSHLMGECFPGL